MDKRAGRKKTIRVKSQGSRVKGQGNSSGVVCKRGNEAIDNSVCVVYQTRNPEQCFGCMHFRG